MIDNYNIADTIPLRILIAEDNQMNQKIVLHVLKKLGYAADTVDNGKEAADAALNTKYDLILMDIQMPVMDGIESAKFILSNSEHIPVITALTANTMDDDLERYEAAGLTGVIKKPVRIDEVAKFILSTFAK